MSTTAKITASEFAAQLRFRDELLLAGTYRRVLHASRHTVLDSERQPQPAVQFTLGGGQRGAIATYRADALVTRRRG